MGILHGIEAPKIRGHTPPRRHKDREPKVAIIHYWLVNMRGGEKVLEELCQMFPQADIYTHVYTPSKVSDIIRQHDVHTTFVSRLPMARKHYRKYLPLMPLALEQLDLSKYDLVISSEAGPAKGVIVRPDALHICYCHSPMRYIWDQFPTYHSSSGFFTRMLMPWLASRLRQWDVTSAARVDHFVANSTSVASRINKYWRRDADVVPPPVETARFDASQPRDDFYLYVGEMVPYKRADIAINACSMMERRLIVIGDGPDSKRLRKMAGPTIEFLGRVPDDILAEHYARCRALLFPTEEDFGIVPVEAMASGAPVIAFGRGGAKDYVIPGVTGVFFDEQTGAGLVGGIARFEMIEHTFDSARLAEQAAYFHKDLFRKRFGSIVRSLLDRGKPVSDDVVIHVEGGAKNGIAPHQFVQ
ncbi:MAG: glycosyltransferase [Hyphomonadaceae bacterium]|nr:glycosyltransferase [Hyphomonadaceae bacterium]